MPQFHWIIRPFLSNGLFPDLGFGNNPARGKDLVARSSYIVLALLLFFPIVSDAMEPVRSANLFGDVVNGVVKGRGVLPPPVAEPAHGVGRPGTRSIPIPSLKENPAARPAAAPGGPLKTTPVGANLSEASEAMAQTRSALYRGPVGHPSRLRVIHRLPQRLERVIGAPLARRSRKAKTIREPRVRAKALYCVDYSSNRVVLSRNVSEPLPIASITKLITAMVVIDEMNLDRVIAAPRDIRRVPRHRVGIRPGDRFTVRDLLHGMLIESGNDCAEALARAYPKGGRLAFVRRMNRKAILIGAASTRIYTPSGLDRRVTLGRMNGRTVVNKRPNVATAEDVARIARHAFGYSLIRRIAGMKRYTMVSRNKRVRKYPLRTNDKLLSRPLPVAGAKTGYTDLAGKCIVALFKDAKKAKDYMVVVLNTRNHFRAAERIYRWACKSF
jgi:D-alanyl-D-alanine carboxypeptidase